MDLKLIAPSIMEASLLNPNQRYAAAALFAIALHHSQVDQTRPTSPLPSLSEETISDGVSIRKRACVSDEPQLWIHENSGLLLPVFRYIFSHFSCSYLRL